MSSKKQWLTRTQAKSKNIIIAQLSSYSAIKNTSTLLSMLASRNNSKPYKPKRYKQPISDHYRHHKNWQKAIQDKIDFFTKNNTWFLSILPNDS